MRISIPTIVPVAALVGGVFLLGACAGGPRLQDVAPSDLFERAQEKMAEEDFGDAQTILDFIVLNYPGFEPIADVSLLLGDAYYFDRKYILAIAQYTRFVNIYPGHLEVPQASLRMCRAFAALTLEPQRDQTQTRSAVQTCQSVARDFPRYPAVADSAAQIAAEMRRKLALRRFQEASFYFQRNGWDASILYFEDVVERYPETEYAPRALLRIIEAYEKIIENSPPDLGYEIEVEVARERLLTEYPLSPEAEKIRAEMARRASEAGTDTLAASGEGSRGARIVPDG
ncbi:MAG: outer membrane protein assembly factor BamD [Longimicrobiales bacterium]|nr:outer membrane protein assembly factor BamD [Longimicrobiales bacterium]